MRLVIYDYTSEKIRGKVRKSLKKKGSHVQLSVFETGEDLSSIKEKVIKENSLNFRLVVFRLRRNAEVIKIGRAFDGSDEKIL
ncbi:CRISPR-associated endonuclease Cas2 [Pampinifervens florentissimum]|uniref:CRISPR-associated endonuclease Cas2 n=1 Tax=Pampinifervens florentissimum TaxID=1632019 RepID=UPI0013B4A028|nr:CRISPR-associated endonuclease Cas2 [Hydrogenobacter sp. T-8]QID32590.1 CRISPR-associated endonuclease Cas2 [Hydrogenobacter sp. T-8]